MICRSPILAKSLFSRGALHIVLSGLKKPLRPYASFDLTLVFEKADAVGVEVMVEENTDNPGTG